MLWGYLLKYLARWIYLGWIHMLKNYSRSFKRNQLWSKREVIELFWLLIYVFYVSWRVNDSRIIVFRWVQSVTQKTRIITKPLRTTSRISLCPAKDLCIGVKTSHIWTDGTAFGAVYTCIHSLVDMSLWIYQIKS